MVTNSAENPAINWNQKYAEKAKEMCSLSNTKQPRQTTPFTRQVDLWFLAVSYGVYLIENTNKKLPKELKKSDYQEILTIADVKIDDHIQNLLELIAIYHTNDITVIHSSSKIIDIANKYAYIGIEELILEMQDNNNLHAMDKIDDMLVILASNNS